MPCEDSGLTVGLKLGFNDRVRREWIVYCGHENNSGSLPHQATRPALAAIKLDENSECGLSGAHRQRESRRATMAFATQKREYAAQAHSFGGILFCARGHGRNARWR